MKVEPGEHLEHVRPVLEHGIEVPDLEVIAHPDGQCLEPLARAALHPRRDQQPTAAVHPRGGGEAEGAAQQIVMALQVFQGMAAVVELPVLLGGGFLVENDDARRGLMQRYI